MEINVITITMSLYRDSVRICKEAKGIL